MLFELDFISLDRTINLNSMKKVAVIFGGRSGEHEVSLVSASSVIEFLDKSRYEVVEIGIAPSGQWLTGKECLSQFKKQNYSGLSKISFPTDTTRRGFETESDFIDIDVVFPVLHGPFGEDGTIQGLLEMLQIPYVGCNVLASSTAMDKLQCKAIWEAAGLPVVPYIGFTRRAWEIEPKVIFADVEKKIGFPCFVKPANMGSSVGITKVKSSDDLQAAIDLAAKFDRRILVEKGLNVREIECAVLGNDESLVSAPGEVIVAGEFYDYFDKYVDGKSSTRVPADISDDLAVEIRELSLQAYKLLDCSGLSRVDSFIDLDSGDIYLNEINTMPGFTSISMYPKMIEAMGIPYPELLDKLIELGFERYEENRKNEIVFDSESDWFK